MPVESNHTWGWPYGRCGSLGYGEQKTCLYIEISLIYSCNNVYKGTIFASYVGLMK